MTRAAWGNTADRALLSLREEGPATSSQLADRLGLTQRQVAGVLVRMVRPSVRGPYAGTQRAHVAGWHREAVLNLKAYLRPIYAAGCGAKAPKPPALTPEQRNKRRRR